MLQELLIDIAGRDKLDNPLGISVRLHAESSLSGIDPDDIGGVFEEHRICGNAAEWTRLKDRMSTGAYLEEEKRFRFNDVMVGAKVSGRFRVTNKYNVSRAEL